MNIPPTPPISVEDDNAFTNWQLAYLTGACVTWALFCVAFFFKDRNLRRLFRADLYASDALTFAAKMFVVVVVGFFAGVCWFVVVPVLGLAGLLIFTCQLESVQKLFSKPKKPRYGEEDDDSDDDDDDDDHDRKRDRSPSPKRNQRRSSSKRDRKGGR